MKKILFIFGTRPEAIKMAPLIKETGQSRSLGIEICVTGQHREMLDQVLKLFDICPDYDLNIMQPGQDLYDITSRILINLRDILQQSKPDLVLVHGDTTTSMAAALAAFYQQIPVRADKHISPDRCWNRLQPLIAPPPRLHFQSSTLFDLSTATKIISA